MRTSAHLLVFVATCTLAAGCQGRTAPLVFASLPESDAGPTATDVGPLDSTVVDTGMVGVDAGPQVFEAGTSNQCRFQNQYTHQLSVGSGDQPYYDGIARVLSVSPLDLQIETGITVRILRGQSNLPNFLEPGVRIWLQFAVQTPQWTNTAVVIREANPRGGPGRVRWVSWALNQLNDVDFEIDEIDLEYQSQLCDPADLGTGCGRALTQQMVVDAFGTTYNVEAGTRTFTRGGEFGNGRSLRYVSGPTCTDTPEYWYEGYVRFD